MHYALGGDSSTKKRRYLFIDGAFLRLLDEEFSKLISDGEEESSANMDVEKVARGYDRIFYYDALPTKKENETDEQFDQKILEIEEKHNCLRLIPNLHVRNGVAKFRRKRGMEQKGVDILLAIEVYKNAMMGNMDEAIIITSDLDFYPIFEALVETRVKASLIYDAGRTSDDLIRSADQSSIIDWWKYFQWTYDDFYKKYKFNDSDHSDSPFVSEELDLIKQGELLGGPFYLYEDAKNNQYVGFSKVKNYSVSSKSKYVLLGRLKQLVKDEDVVWSL